MARRWEDERRDRQAVRIDHRHPGAPLRRERTVTSDIAYEAANDALTSSRIDPESLDSSSSPTTSATCRKAAAHPI